MTIAIDPNVTLLTTIDLVRDLLANFPQLGVAHEINVKSVGSAGVSINTRHTPSPAGALLAWAALLDHPKITTKRFDPLFTHVHVQGSRDGTQFTVTASFEENTIVELVAEIHGGLPREDYLELTVQDLHDLQTAGAR